MKLPFISHNMTQICQLTTLRMYTGMLYEGTYSCTRLQYVQIFDQARSMAAPRPCLICHKGCIYKALTALLYMCNDGLLTAICMSRETAYCSGNCIQHEPEIHTVDLKNFHAPRNLDLFSAFAQASRSTFRINLHFPH